MPPARNKRKPKVSSPGLSSPSSKNASQKAHNTKWMVILVLALIGIGIDSILLYNKLSDTSTACPIGGNCDFVNNSVYSEMFGIPVSVFGILGFAFFFLIAWGGWHKRLAQETALKIIAIAGGLMFLGAMYFVYLMLYVLDAICTWCIFSHTVLLLIVLWAFVHWRRTGGKRA
ncbi:MAG: vitamin K epoxide reductase family protein [Candidatus Diapherotrites archaeon]|nr:vitamin K epoxide reductase family protein [Candidatus Diapherotrites archaeon]